MPKSQPFSVNSLESGERVFRWWDAGIHYDMQPLTVVRVNRCTVTVVTDQGNQFRLAHADVVGYYSET